VCIAYRCLHSLSQVSKTVTLARFLEDFRSRLRNSKIEEDLIDIESRFFNCIGQLEFLGILKCGSSNAVNVRLLYYPSHFLIV
jgi:hypothetical protein